MFMLSVEVLVVDRYIQQNKISYFSVEVSFIFLKFGKTMKIQFLVIGLTVLFFIEGLCHIT